jgi:DNA-binding protein H-NS
VRKPRDFDAELKALTDKARQLKTRKQSQLGELVIACGADALSADELAGALLAAAATTDATTRKAWRERGAAFFQKAGQRTAHGSDRQSDSNQASDRGAASTAGKTGA